MKAVWFIFLFIPVMAFANSDIPVKTCTDLQNINENPAGNFKLVNDIDCEGNEFNVIPFFSGKLSGLNEENKTRYEVRNLKISPVLEDIRQSRAALFGKLSSGAHIHDINFSNIIINNEYENDQLHCTHSSILASSIGGGTIVENLGFDNVKIYGDGITGIVAATAGEISYPYRTTILKNISITNSEIIREEANKNTAGCMAQGMMVGSLYDAELVNSEVSNSYYYFKDAPTNYYDIVVGGLVGKVHNSNDGRSQSNNVIANNIVTNVTLGSKEAPIINHNFGANIGGLIGSIRGNGKTTIQKNKVNEVSLFSKNANEVGGLIGLAITHNLVIQENAVDVNISTCSTKMSSSIGGFAGFVFVHGSGWDDDTVSIITDNYVQGKIEECGIAKLSYQHIGGFLGNLGVYQDASKSIITHNYAAVNMKNLGEMWTGKTVGGFLGNMYLQENSTPVAPIFGVSLWDIQFSEIPTSSGPQEAVLGVGTHRFKDKQWLESMGWNFNTIWNLDLNKNYPILKWEEL